MARLFAIKQEAWVSFSITISGLATNVTNASALVTNPVPRRPGALVYGRVVCGASGTLAGGTLQVLLLRNTGEGTQETTDNYLGNALTDGVTLINAQPLGQIAVESNNGIYADEWDTAPHGFLGQKWGVALRNDTGGTLASSSTNILKYAYYAPELQNEA